MNYCVYSRSYERDTSKVCQLWCQIQWCGLALMITYSWVKYMYVCNTMQYCMYGNGGKTLCIFNLCVKYVCVIGFNLQPLYSRGNDLQRQKVFSGGCSGKQELTVVLLAQRPSLCSPYRVTTVWGITFLIIKLNSGKNSKMCCEG